MTETLISLDPEVSHHTVGGRLYGLEPAPGGSASKAYPYIVLEPDGLPDGLRDEMLAAGYGSIFANDQGELFALKN